MCLVYSGPQLKILLLLLASAWRSSTFNNEHNLFSKLTQSPHTYTPLSTHHLYTLSTHRSLQMAEESNVRIFSADIIYHLFDQFTKYMDGLREVRKKAAEDVVQFPCVLKILPQHIFNKKDPIVIGVEVVEGE